MIKCVSIGVIWYWFRFFMGACCASVPATARAQLSGCHFLSGDQQRALPEVVDLLWSELQPCHSAHSSVMDLCLMFLVSYNFWWTVHLKLSRGHGCVSVCSQACVCLCGFEDRGGGGWPSVPKPMVNEDSPHYKRIVLLTSFGMCGLKLNTGLLSGKPGGRFLFVLYIHKNPSFLVGFWQNIVIFKIHFCLVAKFWVFARYLNWFVIIFIENIFGVRKIIFVYICIYLQHYTDLRI